MERGCNIEWVCEGRWKLDESDVPANIGEFEVDFVRDVLHSRQYQLLQTVPRIGAFGPGTWLEAEGASYGSKTYMM